MKAPNKESPTKAAELIANPLPMAAVVLPAESRASVLSLTLGWQLDISAIPPALSAIGPKASIAKPIDKVDNIPMAERATPNIPASLIATIILMATKITGIMVDLYPKAKP